MPDIIDAHAKNLMMADASRDRVYPCMRDNARSSTSPDTVETITDGIEQVSAMSPIGKGEKQAQMRLRFRERMLQWKALRKHQRADQSEHPGKCFLSCPSGTASSVTSVLP
ncbi:hypothetical protein J2T09_001655 [Neorhizobium huautlense]|uniref:Uncharacterized protein n=1 Tax=Neorhizobium huautlense TaxID=67774 RepID=A0ABT9PR26_9HYPH|nr:hypothetical protein [Neorhizobium huautlense]MDP9836910.1 hypothetical protein [Neorhizobium huautlense]